MLTPKFWDNKGFLAHLLVPVSVFYFIIKRILESLKPAERKFSFYSIIVGNAVTGGAGKTPTVIAAAKMIREKFPDKKLCIVTKGYGGRISSPTLIDITQHDAAEAGDEAQIIAKFANVIVAKDRLKGAEFAEKNGFEVVIFDDGIHDKRIKKDLALLVIEGKYGVGNGFLFPSGPLRDRLDITASVATHIIMIGKDEKKILDKLKRRKIEHPVFKAFINNVTQPEKEQNYVAFAGIGRPQKFFDMLRFEMKLKLLETIEFPDHFNYESPDLDYIKSVATKHNADILTTEKDFVKLPDAFKKDCKFIAIELKFEDKSFENLLEKQLSGMS
jgi:tetraacyldisaccharide 4'-kinase